MPNKGMNASLVEFEKETIWISDYPVHYAGCDFQARMSIVRLSNGDLFLHSPSEINGELKAEIDLLGKVAFIVAPGTYHYLHIPSAQQAFPEAETLICPGIEQKRPEMAFDWILGDQADARLEKDFEQVLVRGNRLISEVAFFHKPTKTLFLVDLIENMTEKTPGIGLVLKFWWKVVFHMWNNPKPAPEYRIGWKDRSAARKSLQKIMEWDFRQIILAHGDLVRTGAKDFARKAWLNLLDGR